MSYDWLKEEFKCDGLANGIKTFFIIVCDAFVLGLALPVLFVCKLLQCCIYLAAFLAPVVSLLFLIEWILKWKH